MYRMDLGDKTRHINDYVIDEKQIGVLFDDHDAQTIIARNQTEIPELNYTLVAPSWAYSFERVDAQGVEDATFRVDPVLKSTTRYDLFYYRDRPYLVAMPEGMVFGLELKQNRLLAKSVCTFDLTNPRGWQ